MQGGPLTAYRFHVYKKQTSRSANSPRHNHRTPWADLIALVAILAFGMVSTVVAHQSIDEVSGISGVLMGMFALWRHYPQ